MARKTFEIEGIVMAPKGRLALLRSVKIKVLKYDGGDLDVPAIYSITLVNRGHDKSANLFKNLALRKLDGIKVRFRAGQFPGFRGPVLEAFNVEPC